MDKLKHDFLIKSNTDSNIKKYVEGRLDENGSYRGWVAEQNINKSGAFLTLNLQQTDDQFLLYCLASSWSASGQWENAATLIYAIKHSKSDLSTPKAWLPNNFSNSTKSAIENFKIYKDIFTPRKKVIKPRSDIFPAFQEIAANWSQLLDFMLHADKNDAWENFVYKLRNIKGLAPRGKSLNIKIPLILRELRCQNIYKTIPGELCCVPDARVIEAIKYLLKKGYLDKSCNMKTYRPTDAKSLIDFSKAIYKVYGDLYDIPLFAASDIYPDFKTVLSS